MLPCSRVAHLERAHKPYLPDLSIAVKRNALRVAEVWMDDYKYMVYFAWNVPIEVAVFLCVSNWNLKSISGQIRACGHTKRAIVWL